MKTTLLQLGVCILLTFQSFSQNPVWVMPPYYLKTNIIQPLPIEPSINNGGNNDEFEPYDYYDGNVAKQGSNGIANLDGDLNFFIIDGNIYNGTDGRFLCYAWGNYSKSPNGYVQEIPINDPITFEQIGYELNNEGSNEIMIIPHPTNCNQYYLFSSITIPTTAAQPIYVPYYALFDLEQEKILKGGPWYGNVNQSTGIYPFFNEFGPQVNGNITVTGTDWFNQTNRTSAPNLSTSKTQSDGSKYILAAMGSLIIVLKMDNLGEINIWKIHVTPIPNELGKLNRNEGELFQDPITGNFSFAFAKANDQAFPVPNTPGSRFIQIVNYTNDFLSVVLPLEYYQINASAGMNPPAVHGLEFSPDGTKLYATISTSLDNPTSLIYVDRSLATPQIVPFDPSKDLNEIQYGQIETTMAGNLRFASANGLYELTNPNSPLASNLSSAPVLSFPNNLTSGTLYPLNPETQLYSLPDQIDFENYSTLFPSNLTCCILNNTYDKNSFTAQNSEIWQPNDQGYNPFTLTNASTVTIKEELRIPAGKSIYLQDMTIQFAPGARLIIANGPIGGQGGKLVLVNSVLTVENSCGTDNMWLGVEVWGNQNQSQGNVLNSSQGVLRMFNGSRIEHAEIGVLVSQRNAANSNLYVDARNGGIVQTNQNSVFTNNKTGVYFRKHNSPSGTNNLSFFIKTKFDWTNALNGNALPKDHIKLDQVKGINIKGCEFNQNSPSLYPINQQGTGINAYISQFYVNSQCNTALQPGQVCTDFTRTSFKDLNYGVFAYYGTTPLSFLVNESEFNNCRYGIYSQRSEKARITNNFFNILEEEFQTAGCAMYYSNAFTIQENNFKELDNPLISNGNGQSYGVLINNAGVADNEVYKNYFQNLKVGGQSERLNGSQVTMNQHQTTGLEWICNSFRVQMYQADLGINGVIGHYQGSFDQSSAANAQAHAARNTFSLAATTNTEHDIMVFNYNSPYDVYPNQQSIFYIQLDSPNQIANDIDASLVHPFFALYNGMKVAPSGTTCPSKIKTTKPIIFQLKNEIVNLKNNIDGGDTQGLLNAIATNAKNNSTNQALMNASPYLSDEVLLAYLQSNASNGHIKNVFVANSKLSVPVYQSVVSSNLPNGIKNNITSAQNNTSIREQLMSEISWTEKEYTLAYNDYTSNLLLDTTELANYDSLIIALEEIGDERAKRDLLLIAIELKDGTRAATLRTELAAFSNPDFLELTEINEALQNEVSNETALQADPTMIADLTNLSANSTCFYSGRSAENILSCVNGTTEVPDFLPLVSPSAMMIGNQSTESSANATEFKMLPVLVSIYPNPSSGNVYFDLPNEEEGKLEIQLIDVTGKEVYATKFDTTNGQLVDLSHIKKGTYIVRITLGESYTESQLLQLRD